MQVTLRIICPPLLALVEGSIQVQEIGEETTSCHFASQLIQVVVSIGRQVADTPFLLPDLYREDGCLAIAHPLIGTLQQLTDDATPLGRSVRTIIDRAEYHLIATAGVNCVHIVDKGLHRLMHPCDRLVDRMLLDACLST